MQWLKASTYEHFRQQIYRPRLTLMILIALLGWTPTTTSFESQTTNKSTATDVTPGTLISFPVLSVDAARHPHVLPPLVQLHALWLVRLLGFALEDRLDSEFITSKRKGSFSRVSAAIALLLAAAALVTSSVAKELLEGFCSDASELTAPVLPLNGIRTVEFTMTAIGLIALLSKVEPFLSSQVQLPSPSHTPSIAETLRLPTWLTECISSRQSTSAPDGTPMQRRAGLAPRTRNYQPGTRFRAGLLPPPEREAPHSPVVDPTEIASDQLTNPLRLQAPRPMKALRQKGVAVHVEATWLVEVGLMVLNRLMAGIQYAVVIISLPSLSPTSLPALLSLLALRSELVECSKAWTSARSSIECLEFIKRRWTGRWATPHHRAQLTNDSAWPQMCAICFEHVFSPALPSPTILAPTANEERTRWEEDALLRKKGTCVLDCGHAMHPTCLVSWLSKQAFCPICHVQLSATPPGMTIPQASSTSASSTDPVAAH